MLRALVLVVLLHVADAIACKCDTSSPFLSNAMSGEVVVVTVVAPGERAVRVSIEKQLAGPKVSGVVVVQGADGGNCNASVREFKKGQRVVMVLSKRGSEFSLNGCGVHWLAVDGANAKGAVDDGVTSLALSELEKRVVEAQRGYEKFKGG
ncbi:MAG: hypothetical protein Q8L14_14420 [Myxococcales bacterium]|nr:hypothetical protein [Myxococcales bacterium]